MLRQRAHLLRSVLMAADAVAMVAAFLVAHYLGGLLLTEWFGLKEVFPLHRYLWVLVVAVPAGWAVLAYYGGYDLARFQGWSVGFTRLWKPLFVHGLLIAAMVFFSKELRFARRVIGLFIGLDFVFVVLARSAALTLAARLGERPARTRRVVLVGAGEGAKRFMDWAEAAGWGLEIVGVLADGGPDAPAPVLGAPAEIGRVLDGEVVDDVIITEPIPLEDVQEILAKSEEIGCIVHIQADFFQAALSHPYVESFGGLSFLTFSATPYSPLLLAVKRAMDILGSAALLILTSPVFVVAPILIKLTSKGEALFRQTRVGLNGREFTMYKFRSMVEDAEELREELEALNERDGAAFKMADDPRVTPVGRVLRRYSLDELPQFWNVFRGDMSLVGPRPPLPDEVRRYERWQRRRLSMRPGVTGLGQTRGRHRLGFDQWMACDLEYIDTWSLWLDMKILAQTVPVILKGGGA